MKSHRHYLVFGLVVLAAYWFTAHNGIVYSSGGGSPSGPVYESSSGVVRSTGRGPSFWSTGYSGGK